MLALGEKEFDTPRDIFVRHWCRRNRNQSLMSLKRCLPPAGLNYRKLTDETSDPLAVLRPVLTGQNVLSISKLAHRLPVPGGGGSSFVSASSVHATWLRKLFWEGDPQLLKRPPQSDQDYLHAYDTCAKYLDRLTPADAVQFLDAITFSAEAVKHVSLEVLRVLSQSV